MKNQHKKIKGYRDLSKKEIALMNKIKQHAEVVEKLIKEVDAHIREQHEAINSKEEHLRLGKAEPFIWKLHSRHSFQVAFMELVRSVAQPTNF